MEREEFNSASRIESFQRISELVVSDPASRNALSGPNCDPRPATRFASEISFALISTVPRSDAGFDERAGFSAAFQLVISTSELNVPRRALPCTWVTEIFVGSTENFPEAARSLVLKLGSFQAPSFKSKSPAAL
jgi:hypothetical protein